MLKVSIENTVWILKRQFKKVNTTSRISLVKRLFELSIPSIFLQGRIEEQKLLLWKDWTFA
jgi:hypothetical protein